MSKRCFFCSRKNATDKLPFIIPKGMKGVMLDVCPDCFDKHGNISYSDDEYDGDDDINDEEGDSDKCSGNRSCMITGKYLVINLRIKHLSNVECCVCEMSEDEINKSASSDQPSKCLAVYYNQLTGLYEMSDIPYEDGEHAFMDQVKNIHKNDYITISRLVTRCSNINFGLGGLLIDGVSIIDWAAINGHANLIKAIGETRPGVRGSDNAFASAVEKEDVDVLCQLIKYNLLEHDGSTGEINKIGAYDIGMNSKNPRIRSLVLLASIHPTMRRFLNIDLSKNLELNFSK